MAYALVGTAGAVAHADPTTPSWGTGESRTAGNLLICVAAAQGTSLVSITASAGWSTAASAIQTAVGAAIFYKIATGADAAPTISTSPTGISLNGSVAEFSGNATTSVLDQHNTATSTPSTVNPSLAVTNPAIDAQTGELVIAINAVNFSQASTGSSVAITWPAFVPTHAFLGGLSANAEGGFNYTSNYGITNSNSAADTFTGTSSSQKTALQMVEVIASFKLPSAAVSGQELAMMV